MSNHLKMNPKNPLIGIRMGCPQVGQSNAILEIVAPQLLQIIVSIYDTIVC